MHKIAQAIHFTWLYTLKVNIIFKLTLCIPMDFPMHIDALSMRLPILYFKGSQLEISKL